MSAGPYRALNSNGQNLPISDHIGKLGLFDFNTATHTTPSWILNFSAGHAFHLAGGVSFEPSLYITNLLDHAHLIKGAHFSGASWEERRNVVVRISVHV
jgi:hypothetical protein